MKKVNLGEPITGEFLSHLSGDEEEASWVFDYVNFLSHLSGDEVD